MKIESTFHVSKCLLFAVGIGAASITSAVPVIYEPGGPLLPGVTRGGAIGDRRLIAVFEVCCNDHRIATDTDANSKAVTRLSIGSL